jgi:hypothetical protein
VTSEPTAPPSPTQDVTVTPTDTSAPSPTGTATPVPTASEVPSPSPTDTQELDGEDYANAIRIDADPIGIVEFGDYRDTQIYRDDQAPVGPDVFYLVVMPAGTYRLTVEIITADFSYSCSGCGSFWFEGPTTFYIAVDSSEQTPGAAGTYKINIRVEGGVDTPTPQPTDTQEPTQTINPTLSPEPSPSGTSPTQTATASPSPSPSASPSVIPTTSPTVNPTIIPSPTSSPTFMPSPTPPPAVQMILDAILSRNTQPGTTDSNGDGIVDIADIIYLLKQ